MLTMTICWSLGRVAATRTPSQIACDDSKAETWREQCDQQVGTRETHTWNNSFQLGDQPESSQSLFVSRDDVLCATGVFEPGMFRPNAWIIKAGAYGVCLDDLTRRRLQDVRAHAVKDARLTFFERSAVLVPFKALAASLNTNEQHAFVFDEVIERPDSITATPDACNDGVRQPTNLLVQLGLDLLANNFLEVADNGRERVGTNS